LALYLGGSQVASAISGITNYPRSEPFLCVLACALLAAVGWNFLTRLAKVPSSSTHALVGGLIGAIFASTGSFEYIVWGNFNALIHPTGVCKVIATLFPFAVDWFWRWLFYIALASVFAIKSNESGQQCFKEFAAASSSYSRLWPWR
jgi:phosphate/sulfate permease